MAIVESYAVCSAGYDALIDFEESHFGKNRTTCERRTPQKGQWVSPKFNSRTCVRSGNVDSISSRIISDP
jgi:hypothetical protein